MLGTNIVYSSYSKVEEPHLILQTVGLILQRLSLHGRIRSTTPATHIGDDGVGDCFRKVEPAQRCIISAENEKPAGSVRALKIITAFESSDLTPQFQLSA